MVQDFFHLEEILHHLKSLKSWELQYFRAPRWCKILHQQYLLQNGRFSLYTLLSVPQWATYQSFLLSMLKMTQVMEPLYGYISEVLKPPTLNSHEAYAKARSLNPKP